MIPTGLGIAKVASTPPVVQETVRWLTKAIKAAGKGSRNVSKFTPEIPRIPSAKQYKQLGYKGPPKFPKRTGEIIDAEIVTPKTPLWKKLAPLTGPGVMLGTPVGMAIYGELSKEDPSNATGAMNIPSLQEVTPAATGSGNGNASNTNNNFDVTKHPDYKNPFLWGGGIFLASKIFGLDWLTALLLSLGLGSFINSANSRLTPQNNRG